jgi:hypothetical protein
LPPEQSWSIEHVAPHVPQFAESVFRSEHVDFPQSVPELQPHCPALQCVSPEHARPQPPQLASSVLMATHAPLHAMSSGPHIETHLPLEQSHPVSHAVPHAPQFAASAWRLAHVPPQFVEPCGHAHLPPAHVADWTQATPQPPQLLVSVCVSTHAPAQNVSMGDSQESWHTPLMHEAPAGHWWLHTPQLFGSLCVSPQEDWEPLPPPFDELHPVSATTIAELQAIVAQSANRTRL